MNGADSLDNPMITIQGKGITIDFNGATLVGSTNSKLPNEFSGLGILIKKGSQITIKNVIVKGYKAGLMATGIEGLTIEDADFSYNYRQRLKSKREKEDLSDWLSYHNNENDEIAAVLIYFVSRVKIFKF